MIKQDYILRLVEQMAAVVARMFKAGQGGDYIQAETLAKEGYDALGVPGELMVRMDSISLAKFVGQADKIRLLSELSWKEGELLKAKGDPINGLDRFRRAVELLLEAQKMDPQQEDAAKLQEMVRHIPINSLHPRYRVKQSEG